MNGFLCEPFNDYFQIICHQQNTRNNDHAAATKSKIRSCQERLPL